MSNDPLRLVLIFYSNVIAPFLLVILPALVSLALNVVLYCFIRRYARASNTTTTTTTSQQTSLKNSMINRDDKRPETLEKGEIKNVNVNKASGPMRKSSSSSAAQSLVIRSRSREVVLQSPYHFTLIMINLMDLPYHMLYLIYWLQSLLDNCKTDTSQIMVNDSSAATVYEFLKLFFVFNHSINVFVYLLFHREFKSTLSGFFCCCCCFVG